MQTENQLAKDQTPANADAQQAPSLEAKYKEAQRLVSLALGLGEEGTAEVAQNFSLLIKTRPELRSEILAILHEQFGNAFVRMVTHPAEHDTKNAVKGAAAGAADATAPAPPAPSRLSEKGQAVADEVMQNSLEFGEAQKFGSKGGAAGAASPAQAPEAAKPQMDSAAQVAAPAPAPAAQGPAPAPDSVETKQQEPAPQHPKEPASPANEVAPPAKQDVASAGQSPVAAPPVPEAAPKKDAADKAKEEEPANKADGSVKITASALRFRAEPSPKGAILGKIPRGTIVKVEGHEGAWLKVTWGGQPGFIHSKYTTAVKGNESGEEEEEHQGEEPSHEQKQERPKAPPMVNDDQQKAVV